MCNRQIGKKKKRGREKTEKAVNTVREEKAKKKFVTRLIMKKIKQSSKPFKLEEVKAAPGRAGWGKEGQ